MNDYRQRVAAIRTRRDKAIARATARARTEIARAVAERDETARTMRAAGHTLTEIGAALGCSRAMVHELLGPHTAYNARRAAHWRRTHADLGDPDAP